MIRPYSTGSGRVEEVIHLHDRRDRQNARRVSDERRLAAGEPPQSLPQADWSRFQRLVAQVAIEIVGQRRGRAVAIGRRLFERPHDDSLEFRRNLRVDPVRQCRLPFEHLEDRIQLVLFAKRRPAGEEFVKHGAKAIDIGARRNLGRIAAGLLGGHVARRAEDRAGLRFRAVILKDLGQPEIGHQGLVVLIEQDVRRLEVAMDDAVGMQVVHGSGDGGHQPRGAVRF